jgi:hypothetical protein
MTFYKFINIEVGLLLNFGKKPEFERFIYDEAVSNCSILFKIKEGENFNHRNTLSISRIKI